MKILEGEGKTVGLKGAYLSERMAKGNAFLFDIYKCAYNVFFFINLSSPVPSLVLQLLFLKLTESPLC